MDVAEAIRKRRSVRHYKPDKIPEDVLNRLLEALRLAPSGGNRQPLRFVVVRDKKTLAKVASACHAFPLDGDEHKQGWVKEAPLIIVPCGFEKEASAGFYAQDGRYIVSTGKVLIEYLYKKPEERLSSVHTDLAIALDHLTLAATAEGLGTCWVGGLNGRELRRYLSIPDDLMAHLIVTVGYPVSWPEPTPRKPLEEIICYDKFS